MSTKEEYIKVTKDELGQYGLDICDVIQLLDVKGLFYTSSDDQETLLIYKSKPEKNAENQLEDILDLSKSFPSPEEFVRNSLLDRLSVMLFSLIILTFTAIILMTILH